MDQGQIIIFSIIGIIILIIFIIVVILMSMEKGKKTVKAPKTSYTPITIDDAIKVAKNTTTDRDTLDFYVKRVARTLPFPGKVDGKPTEEGRRYLQFVLLITSHPNANAKLIANMDNLLKEANQEYKAEIDIYENLGIGKRSNKPK